MKNLTTLVLLLAAVAACGDDKHATPDAPDTTKKDAAIDAPPAFPAAPTLGTQIDRMGRPAINTALNAVLETDATKKMNKKDAYNHAVAPSSWKTTNLDSTVPTDVVLKEFATNIAIFDVIDKGVTGVPNGGGCGNTVGYMAPGGADPNLTSYGFLATVLADDELYVDTTKGVCNFYLDLEVEAAASVPHQNCGGRTPVHDVVDFSYSVLGAGVAGFDASMNFAPRIGDGASAHTDVSTDTFPFLGAPH